MRENRTYGSEGGEAKAFPTPISRGDTTRRPPAQKPGDPDLMVSDFGCVVVSWMLAFASRTRGDNRSAAKENVRRIRSSD